ncbi:DUF2147 domain-containing protein [Pelotalea chapellei]|uniref:DUF2147 domain-containing protein n=1 Tax=Pelotalea chapellei TaxID=44671 RepID=A0ABS5UAB4_9BACT|nr:DUF2147 domain-containing protein [Pelotalea chapellei]MBT1072599.1 DUF2147 domain-containing protein [Pelotalea chapellei]
MRIALILGLIIWCVVVDVYAGQHDILGKWKTEKGDVQLDFFQCEEKICAKIVWLQHPEYKNEKDGPVGTAKTDRKNPDPAMRSRPVLGLRVVSEVTPAGENQWGGGICYDPQTGKTYKCKMKMVSPDRLEMRGYIGFSLFGRDYVLVR